MTDAAGAGRSTRLRDRATSGILALLSRHVASILIELPASIAMARLLAPSDFGLYAIVSFIVHLLAQSASLGMGAWLIQKGEPPTDKETATVYTFQLAFCAVVACVIWLGAPSLMGWYGRHDEGATYLLRVMGLSVFLIAFRTVPLSLLERALDYTKLAWIELSGTLVFQLTGVTLAALGLGVWSLAVGLLASSAATTLQVALRAPWHPGLGLDRNVLRVGLKFGMHWQLFQWVNVAKDNVVPTLIAVRFGPAAVGYVNLASGIASRPLFLMPTLQRVSFATYSRLYGNTEQLRTAVEYTLFLGLLVVAPPTAILAGLADPLVALVWGAKWLPAAPALRWFCASNIGIAVSWTAMSSLFALGKPSIPMRITAVWAAALWALAFPFTARWGFTGFAMLYLAASVIGFWSVYELKRFVPVRVAGTVTPVLAVSIVSGGIASAVASTVSITLPLLIFVMLALLVLSHVFIVLVEPARVLACLSEVRRGSQISAGMALDRLLASRLKRETRGPAQGGSD